MTKSGLEFNSSSIRKTDEQYQNQLGYMRQTVRIRKRGYVFDLTRLELVYNLYIDFFVRKTQVEL